MSAEIMQDAKERMTKAIESLNRELAKLRAGRANPAILDRVTVEYYGAETPLNQLATITVPEARLLMIQPFDKTSMNDIERAIQKADLGLTPSNDGTVIRIAIPPLTEERRRELVKLVKKSAEEGKVAVRNVRRDANDDLKKLQKDGEMTEDELRRYTDDVQKLTDKHISDIDAVADKKEKEIMEV
ncbi:MULTISPECIES: ribosome recycling factor [Alkalihalophilus]|uniref:Ribosome-recycling factor n=2 Tax=Alkalihalophilus pseudofirmus TaxID=79885 RepID=D3FT07_ALKPO|nr:MULTISPECIES: ribosome recycling factor [Alkalihalophilus]ADC48075.1 ribosome recycling factor [Alkalihalophilus pseudofirmus OF4]MDV2885244.1 ribosome recycling factor [Alkalihalophilus pseudofirmus]MEC2073136.1 ribosome recycling factor [Alkalihalophilus marmarensis]MED1602318.1 ribosome recycling factor [Alkalihalophilus marmarensis]OLS37501.1 ribosome recycling factor [Alkalihalophilus pseudofirmus]